MYKLYYSAGACSMAVHTVLNECGVPFELIDVSIKGGKNRSPEFLKINPRASVPVLDDNGTIIREGAAILMYLCEKHQCPLLPMQAGSPQRAQALEWLCFANSTLHPAYGRTFWLNRNAADEQQRALLEPACQVIRKLWDEVEQQLKTQPYLCGTQCTVADILCSVIANWNGMLPHPMTFGSKTKAMFKAVVARPAYQKALGTEQVEYKAAA